MHLTIIGCGDAFGTGGRLQSAYLLDLGDRKVLLDCGATTQIGFNRIGFNANEIDTVLISHLHGDHFAGLIWMLLSALYVTKRKAPLKIVGPPTIAARFTAMAEALFPDVTKTPRAFDLEFIEISAGTPYVDADLHVTAFEVRHPSGAPSHALRIKAAQRTLAFSGDTEWVDTLVPCAANADLLLIECCAVDRPMKFHLNWRTIEQHLPQLSAKRIMLTHMNADMLAFAPSLKSDRILIAEDGLKVSL